MQELLTILEEGFNSTQLIKFARLSAEQKKAAEETYDIKFVGTCRVMFVTNCVWFAATYNPEYVVDNAFASRWEIMKPAKELGSDLTKWINRHHWHLDKDVIEALRGLVNTRPDPNLKAFYYEHLPDELYEKHIRVSPRATRSLKVYKLCRAFWGLETPDSMLMDRFRSLVEAQESVSESYADKVIQYIRKYGPVSYEDILKGLEIQKAVLYDVLKRIDCRREKRNNTTYYSSAR